MQIIILTLIVSLILSLAIGFLLGFFKKLFYVAPDETVAKIREVLPGANCGACGFPGCDGFAAAVASGNAPVNGCSVGAGPVAAKVGAIQKSQFCFAKVRTMSAKKRRIMSALKHVAPQRFQSTDCGNAIGAVSASATAKWPVRLMPSMLKRTVFLMSIMKNVPAAQYVLRPVLSIF